ncbi:hypothetical protein C8R43DRAFT_944432 [Mycena crocata]|nr:hypothetical protein C8R43DRAFT_944432 [Mycena crocata]
MSLGCVPTGGTVQLYFTHAGQHVNWDDMIESLGLGLLSHLHMRARTLGGATDAEGLDEWGEPDKSKPCQLPRKPKRKAQPVATNLEDNDFDGVDGSSSDDSDVEMVMSNKEVAPSHLLKGKERATEPVKKRCKKGSAPANSSQPIVSTSTSSAPAPDNTPPTERTSRKKQGLNVVFGSFCMP